MDAGTAKEERMWAMIAHYAPFSGHFVPFGNIIGPLVVWILKKDQFPLVNDQGKEAHHAFDLMSGGRSANHCLN